MRVSGGTVYVHGNWNARCDVCGFDWKASDLRLRWDGLMCCPWDFEIRNPQDFVRAKPDKLAPPFVRTDQEETFVPIACTLQGISCIAGFAVAGCSIAGLVPSGVFPYNP